MRLTYPAIFYPWQDKGGFTVEVPDLPGCVSEGDTLAEAILMGTDAASGWVLTELEDGKPAPAASPIKKIKPERLAVLLVCWFLTWTHTPKSTAIKQCGKT